MSLRKLAMAAAAALSMSAAAVTAQATTTILVFGQTGSDLFTATNPGPGGSMGGTVLSGIDIPVNITTYAGGASAIPAFLTLNATSTSTAGFIGAPINQFGQSFTGSFAFRSGTLLTGANYLSGTFNGGFLGLGAAATLSANTTLLVTDVVFTSDFLSPLDIPRGMTFSFTNISPELGGGGFNLCGPAGDLTICAFQSNISGNMSAFVVVPGPASIAVLGLGLLALGAVARRRLA